MEKNFQESFLVELNFFFEPLVDASLSKEEANKFFLLLGWDLKTILGNADLGFLNQLNSIIQNVGLIKSALNTPPQSLSDLRSILATTNSITQSIRDLATELSAGATFLQGFNFIEFSKDVFEKLFVIYLIRRVPDVYNFFYFIGVIIDGPEIIISNNNPVNKQVIKKPSEIPSLDLNKISAFISNPSLRLKQIFWPNNFLPQTGQTSLQAANDIGERLFSIISHFLGDLGLVAFVGREGDAPPPANADEERLRGLMTIAYERFDKFGNSAEIGATFGLVPLAENGPGVYIVPFGAAQTSIDFDDWILTLNTNVSIPPLKITDKVEFISNAPNLLNATFTFSSVPEPEGQIKYLIGSTTGTRLEIGEIVFQGNITKSSTLADYGVMLNLNKAAFVINPGDGDGFLKKLLPPGGKRAEFDLGIGWAKGKGIFFQGSGGLEVQIPISGNDNDSLLKLRDATIGIQADNSGINIYATASGDIKLGPVTAAVDQIGLRALFTFPSNGGNLGPINADIGFKPPKGVGILVDSDAVTGGGYLFFDPTNGQYAGIAQLKVGDNINLKAVGLLSTQQSAGYSLLLMITAEFSPIQLGLGFTLSGVGGLVGINRTANDNKLRTSLRDGSINHLLFPENPLRDRNMILATVGQAFPVADGHYVFGLMGKIGWGSPTLITLDAGIIIEFPQPVRMVILGVLRALLPSEQNPILRLQVNFIGNIDFQKKQISFDAVIFDSRILNYTLSGDMAFRLYQGNNPLFLISAGGFHPNFQPPAAANVNNLQRLRLAISDTDDFRLILSSYFAVTSNTVQFGSQADFYAHIYKKWDAVGYFSFDVLFQFSPFYVSFSIGISLAIRRDGDTKLSLDIQASVSGPGPWHFRGKVEIDIWLLTYTKNIDRTFGNGVSQPALENVSVKGLLKQALERVESWEASNPPLGNDLIAVKEIPKVAGKMVINPFATLMVRQQVVPLNLQLGRYGNKQINGPRKLDIFSAHFGNSNSPAVALTEIKDFFAPGEYLQLTKDERLYRPSFEQFKSGVKFKGTEAYKGGAFVSKLLEYELIEMETKIEPRASQAVSINYNTMARMTSGGAVGNSSLSNARNSPSALSPAAVQWQDQGFAIADLSVLSRFGGNDAPSTFSTQAEAEEYLQQLLHQLPEMEGLLEVVPEFELVA